jgi:hypothetical protein
VRDSLWGCARCRRASGDANTTLPSVSRISTQTQVQAQVLQENRRSVHQPPRGQSAPCLVQCAAETECRTVSVFVAGADQRRRPMGPWYTAVHQHWLQPHTGPPLLCCRCAEQASDRFHTTNCITHVYAITGAACRATGGESSQPPPPPPLTSSLMHYTAAATPDSKGSVRCHSCRCSSKGRLLDDTLPCIFRTKTVCMHATHG